MKDGRKRRRAEDCNQGGVGKEVKTQPLLDINSSNNLQRRHEDEGEAGRRNEKVMRD